MKYTKIHIPSVLIGVANCALVFLAIGAQKPTTYKWPVEESLRIEGIPRPDELWSLVLDDSVLVDPLDDYVAFTVPMDKRLVVTHVFLNGQPASTRLYRGVGGVHSEPVADSSDSGYINTAEPNKIPPATFGPGEDVIFHNTNNNSAYSITVRVYGYLVDA